MNSDPVARQTVSPPMLARMLGVGLDKVHHWIKTGELSAFNCSRSPNQRPRWQISFEAVEEFKRRRSNSANTAPVPRRRRREKAGYTKFTY